MANVKVRRIRLARFLCRQRCGCLLQRHFRWEKETPEIKTHCQIRNIKAMVSGELKKQINVYDLQKLVIKVITCSLYPY